MLVISWESSSRYNDENGPAGRPLYNIIQTRDKEMDQSCRLRCISSKC